MKLVAVVVVVAMALWVLHLSRSLDAYFLCVFASASASAALVALDCRPRQQCLSRCLMPSVASCRRDAQRLGATFLGSSSARYRKILRGGRDLLRLSTSHDLSETFRDPPTIRSERMMPPLSSSSARKGRPPLSLTHFSVHPRQRRLRVTQSTASSTPREYRPPSLLSSLSHDAAAARRRSNASLALGNDLLLLLCPYLSAKLYRKMVRWEILRACQAYPPAKNYSRRLATAYPGWMPLQRSPFP